MKNIKNIITKDFVEKLYDRSTDGIQVIKSCIPENKLLEINSLYIVLN